MAGYAGAVLSTGSPVIGALTGAEAERMNAVRARLFAEADMAAERRAERRRAANGATFTLVRKLIPGHRSCLTEGAR